MFGKLLKHKLRDQLGSFSILSVAVLVTGLIGSAMMLMILMLAETNIDSAEQVLGLVFAILVLYAIIFLLGAYVTAVSIMLYYNFYKQHFSDQGYLTFTLPATTHQHLLSSMLNMFIYNVLSIVFVFLTVCVILFPMVFYVDWRQFLGDMIVPDYSFSEIFSREMGEMIYVELVTLLGSVGYSMILPMFSITLGSLIAKRLKLLVSFGVMYGIHIAVYITILMLQIMASFGYFYITQLGVDLSVFLPIVGTGIIYLGLTIGGYFLMHRMIQRKLNLP